MDKAIFVAVWADLWIGCLFPFVVTLFGLKWPKCLYVSGGLLIALGIITLLMRKDATDKNFRSELKVITVILLVPGLISLLIAFFG